MTSLRLTSITIEGMHNIYGKKTYDLSKNVYFHGRNGVGKSTILQGIQLALLGYIPGTAKQNAAIFKHCNGHYMAVRLTLKDEDNRQYTIVRAYTASKSSVSCDFYIEGLDDSGKKADEVLAEWIGDIEIPIFNFTEFTSLTANKLKDWFIDFLPESNTRVNIKEVLLELIPDSVVESAYNDGDSYYKEVIIHAETLLANSSSPIEGVRAINDYLKSQLTFKKGEFQRLETTIQGLIYYDDADDSEDVETLTAKADELTKDVNETTSKLAIARNNNDIGKQMNQLVMRLGRQFYSSIKDDPDYLEMVKSIESKKAEMEQTRNLLYDFKHKVDDLSSKIKANNSVIDGKGVCPYTNSECSSISDLIETYKAENEKYDEELTNTNRLQIVEENRYNKLELEVVELEEHMKEMENLYTSYRAMNNSIDHRISVMETVEVLTKKLEEYTGYLSSVSDKLVKARANKKYNELADNLNVDKNKISTEMSVLKTWITETDMNGLQSKMMIKPFEEFGKTISSYLPYFSKYSANKAEFKFNIDGGKNDFNFGIQTADEYINYNSLSSGEKCCIAFAMMYAILNQSDSKIKVLMIDDMIDHLDHETASDIFEFMRSNQGSSPQMVFAGVNTCDIPNSSDIKKSLI